MGEAGSDSPRSDLDYLDYCSRYRTRCRNFVSCKISSNVLLSVVVFGEALLI